jgi:hypothetical protein
MFTNFKIVQNFKIANNSKTTKAREKVSTDLESLDFKDFFAVSLTKL